MLKKVSIKNYRNLESVDSNLDPKINLIIAPNGRGKTNLLESIHYIAYGEPFRSVELTSQILGQKEPFAKINVETESVSMEVVVSVENDFVKRKFSVNGKRIKISDLSSHLPVVLFAPNSVDLVAKEPSIRRKDLDRFLELAFKDYGEHLELLEKVLKNRNAVLQAISERKSDINELEFWTNKLIDVSFEVFIIRQEFFNSIKKNAAETIEMIKTLDDTNRINSLSIEYAPNIVANAENFKEVFKEKFNSNQQKEIIVGRTLYGIHKDDYKIFMNNENLRFMGSRGQQRIGVFALKLAQIHFYKELKGESPLFLVDDLMSELDDENRQLVAKLLVNLDLQFILTSADVDEVPEILFSSGNRIDL
jgi:DNA replication and repair protein RecF